MALAPVYLGRHYLHDHYFQLLTSADIRTTTTNPDDIDEQVKTVASFADRNGLKLSMEKCGIVIAGRDGTDLQVSRHMVVF